jgi:hypothetical protein
MGRKWLGGWLSTTNRAQGLCAPGDSQGSAVGTDLVASEMNERYKRRLLRNWDTIKEKLQSIRMVKHGNKAKVDAFCLTQNT